MNILITGGMGFIGKHLVRKLIEDPKNKVVVVDNMSSCDYAEFPVEFFKTDFYSYEPDRQFDQIYHLAGPVGPVGVLRYPGTMGVEIINLLNRAAKMAIDMKAKLIFISTSEVYGKNPIFDQAEDIEKIVPANITVRLEYGVSKLLGEIILRNLSRKNDLHYNIIRPFNIIGTGQNADLGFVVPRFIQQALRGEDMTIYGDGTNKRTFTNVKDIVEAMVMIMASDVNKTVFNIGHPGNQITIGELARLIKKMTNSNSRIAFVDPKDLHGQDFAEAWNKIPNIDRAKSLLGWKPVWTLEETLKECIEEELCES